MESQDGYLLNELATTEIRQLVEAGWYFMLNIEKKDEWEADFTRKIPGGWYDNHEVGGGTTANEAVHNAYQNIKQGKRLRR